MTTAPFGYFNNLRNSLSGVKVVLEQVRDNFDVDESTLDCINNAIEQIEQALIQVDQEIDGSTLELLNYYEEKHRNNPNLLQNFFNFFTSFNN